jgi:hypothetical protein
VLEAPGSAPFRAGIFDLRGRVVAELASGPRTPGTQRLLWDGRDARGLRVAAGVYFLRVDGGDRLWTRKLVRVD